MNKIIFLTTFLFFTIIEQNSTNAMDENFNINNNLNRQSANNNFTGSNINILSNNNIFNTGVPVHKNSTCSQNIWDSGTFYNSKTKKGYHINEIKEHIEQNGLKSALCKYSVPSDQIVSIYYVLCKKNEKQKDISYGQILNSVIQTKSIIETANDLFLDCKTVYDVWANSTFYDDKHEMLYSIKDLIDHINNNGLVSTINYFTISTHNMIRDIYYCTLYVKNKINDSISYEQILDSIIRTKSVEKTAKHFVLDYNTVYNIWSNSTIHSEKKNKIYSIKDIVKHINIYGLKSAFDEYQIRNDKMFSIYHTLCVPNTQISYEKILDDIHNTKSIAKTAHNFKLSYDTIKNIWLKSAVNNYNQTKTYSIEGVTNDIKDIGLIKTYDKYLMQDSQIKSIFYTLDTGEKHSSYNEILKYYNLNKKSIEATANKFNLNKQTVSDIVSNIDSFNDYIWLIVKYHQDVQQQNLMNNYKNIYNFKFNNIKTNNK